MCLAEGRLDLLLDIVAFLRAGEEPELVRRGNPPRLHLAYPHFGEGSVLPDRAYRVTITEWVGGRRIEAPRDGPRPSLARRVVRRTRRALLGVVRAPRAHRA
ncbi:Putative glycosyl transferase OS=Streptomyces griseus subsp. griseus (strain JCM 4626 / NBRC)OX=455632 GN=SGR_4958 PE=4 SV=1 [Streptomyces griseus subsp. griseus]